MKLSEETKKLILEEFEAFKDKMYAGKTKAERKELGQFFTPGSLCIEMLERYDCDTLVGKTILDPTCGSGNLLAAALIAGADSDKVFGNDYDPIMVDVCLTRLNNVCDMLGKSHVAWWQIHRGDATDPFCLEYFAPNYKEELIKHYIANQITLFPELTAEQIEFLKDVK